MPEERIEETITKIKGEMKEERGEVTQIFP